MKLSVLKTAWQEAKLPSHLEHVTPFINSQPNRFIIKSLKEEKDLSHHRWTVDEVEDFEFVKHIYEELYPSKPDFDTKDILALLEKKPELYKINQKFKRNEGMQSSIKKDDKYKKTREIS